MASLTVTLKTILGDADLSTSTKQISQSQLMFDQVTVTNLTTDLVITVSGTVQSEYSLILTPKYKPTVDQRLVSALPLVEGRGVYITIPSATSEQLVSYRPWWTDHEQRTIFFVAESQSGIYFYADVDVYPLNYQTQLIDNNNIITILPGNPQYKLAADDFGTYYIRIRPDYLATSLVSKQSFILNFYAFS